MSNVVLINIFSFFKIAGTIVTYEIVLMQFSQTPNEASNKNNTINDCP